MPISLVTTYLFRVPALGQLSITYESPFRSPFGPSKPKRWYVWTEDDNRRLRVVTAGPFGSEAGARAALAGHIVAALASKHRALVREVSKIEAAQAKIGVEQAKHQATVAWLDAFASSKQI